MAQKSGIEIGDVFGALCVFGLIAFTGWIILSPNSDSNTDAASKTSESPTSTRSTDVSTGSPEVTPINTEEPKGSCVDVTSYDYNWDNDMKCTRPNGTVFYTDYAGARAYEN